MKGRGKPRYGRGRGRKEGWCRKGAEKGRKVDENKGRREREKDRVIKKGNEKKPRQMKERGTEEKERKR